MNYSFSLQIVEKKPGFPNQKKKKKKKTGRKDLRKLRQYIKKLCI